MTLIKKFSAPLVVVALVAMMAVSLVGQTPRTASAAAGEICKVSADTTSSFLGNSTSTGAVTSVNSGTTTTLRIHIDDFNSSTATVGLTASAGAVNGQAATAANIIFLTAIDAGAQLCAASGLPNTQAGAVATTVDDSYVQFSFTAPTLPSGIQSQLIQFRVDGDNSGAFGTANVDATYFLTVATAASSLTVGTPDDLNISATAAATDAAGAAIVATVKDGSGTNITGATVDVVTTAGGLDQNVVGTCTANNAAGTGDTTPNNLTQSCSAQTDGSGQVIPTLYGLGAGGTATVTFTVRGTGVTGSTTVIISALPATLEVSGRRTDSATSFVAKSIVENKDSSTTNRDELTIAAVAKDANGNVVGAGNVTFTLTGPAGHTILFSAVSEGGITLSTTACSVSGAGTNSCVDDIAPAAAGATTPSHATAYIDVDHASGEPLGTYTVTATIAGNNATITGTTTFTLAKAPATLTIGDIPTVGLGQTQAATITCKDADGNPCAMGTLVQVNVSNANLIAQNASTGTTGVTVADLTTNATGVATVSLIGVTSGTTNIVANVGTITAVSSVTVGTGPIAPPPPPPAAGTGTFTGATIAPSGLTIVSFTGTHAQLTTAGTTAKVVSASGTFSGKLLTFVIGAPDFVNVEFVAATSTGLSNTLLIVKTGG